MPLLEVEHLSVSFVQYAGGFKQKQVKVVNDLNIAVKSGEIVAVVGASGSGKSILAHAILGILPGNARVHGEMKYNGKPLTEKLQAGIRGKEMVLVPQSVNYLDPLMHVGKQVRHSARGQHSVEMQRAVFKRYGLDEEVERKYPFQLSGGMARRVLVSTAMISGASLIIADEPTPGLDQQVVVEALNYFRELADQGCGVLLITHDISSVLHIADKIAVFYAGTTVEIAAASDFSDNGEKLRHPYTKALWKALPQNDFAPICGGQPLQSELINGCPFQPRCNIAVQNCTNAMPEIRLVREGIVRCDHAT